jgi:hypothetical protein
MYHTNQQNIQKIPNLKNIKIFRFWQNKNFYRFSGYNKYMATLDNFEQWADLNFESKPIPEKDGMGREIFWEQIPIE